MVQYSGSGLLDSASVGGPCLGADQLVPVDSEKQIQWILHAPTVEYNHGTANENFKNGA